MPLLHLSHQGTHTQQKQILRILLADHVDGTRIECGTQVIHLGEERDQHMGGLRKTQQTLGQHRTITIRQRVIDDSDIRLLGSRHFHRLQGRLRRHHFVPLITKQLTIDINNCW